MTKLMVLGMLLGSAGWPARADAQARPATTQQDSARYVDPTAGLALDEAVRRALDREPALRASRSEIDVARGMHQQSALRPNPNATLLQQFEPGGTDRQTRLEFEWPLDLFRRAGRVAVADAELQATQLSVADLARRLASDVRLKYGDVAEAVQELSVREDLLAVVEQQYELVRTRVEQGATPPLERDVVDAERQTLEAERLLQKGRVDQRLTELDRLVGERPNAPLQIRQTLEQLVMGDTVPAPIGDRARALQMRTDVQEAEARTVVAQARLDQARQEGRFDVSLFGMYMRMDAGFPQRGFNPNGQLERVRGLFHGVAGGATLSVPLRNRNQGAIAAAEAARTGAELTLEAARLSAEAEVSAAEKRTESARLALAVYAGGLRGLARKNLDVISQTYELGRASTFEVLTAQRQYLEVERAYIAVLREAFDASVNLRRALGETP